MEQVEGAELRGPEGSGLEEGRPQRGKAGVDEGCSHSSHRRDTVCRVLTARESARGSGWFLKLSVVLSVCGSEFCYKHFYGKCHGCDRFPLLHTQELKDPHCRDEMAAARGALKKNATMLYTASQAFLRHPDVAATRANRDYVFKQVQEAIAGISNAAQATSPTDEAKGHTGIGELAAALNEFDVSIRVTHTRATRAH